MPATLRPILAISAVLVLATLLATSPARADLAAGMFAYDQGDYATALAEWTPLAEDGDPTAQALLGLMYRGTPGIQADNAVSAGWYAAPRNRGIPTRSTIWGWPISPAAASRRTTSPPICGWTWPRAASRPVPTGPTPRHNAATPWPPG